PPPGRSPAGPTTRAPLGAVSPAGPTSRAPLGAVRPAGPTSRAPLGAVSPAGPTTRAPLGAVAGARSGDKGGDANVGVWVESPAAWDWLRTTLTVEALQDLLPETRDLPVVRHELPNLRALNFEIRGLLGDGVASGHRFDPQAKALGEWLRARHLDIPTHLLPSAPEGTRP
ncbi:AtuA-related protein, partial [Streptomyces sp. NPDC054797]